MRIWKSFAQPETPPARLTCYTKAGCCLCDQAHKALDRLAARGLATAEYIPIEGDADLMARFGTRIPVVMLDDRVLAEGKVSEVWLARALAAETTRAAR
jgi:hypothetical protein